FAEAKELTEKCLNSCPPKVICCFINHSSRFVSAYRKELTGKAAVWAVRNPRSSSVTECSDVD
ncbi:hypothetical protein AN958_00966, partial [Leucoagaricus sp. SymC.cos]